MKTIHRTMIHAVCPHGGWDYYAVTFEPEEFMTVEDFQDVCDEVRGREVYQEDLTKAFGLLLLANGNKGRLTLTGQHGTNTNTETVCDVE